MSQMLEVMFGPKQKLNYCFQTYSTELYPTTISLTYSTYLMPSLQKLQKAIATIKNQLISASNYLELETAIALFNQLKHKHLLTAESEAKKNKISAEDYAETQTKTKLIQTTQQLIREKIKYFKKIALKKMEAQTKQPSPLDDKPFKKQRTSKRQSSNLESALTVAHKRKSKQTLPSFFGTNQLNQLKALQSRTSQLQKTLNNSNQKPRQSESRRSGSRSEKKLKQSRSAQNFFSDKLKDTFTFRDEQQSQTKANIKSSKKRIEYSDMSEEEYEMDDSKTQIQVFGKKGKKVEEVEDVEYLRGKVETLQKMFGSIKNGQGDHLAEGRHMFEQLHYKLREKSLQLQQVRGRLKHYQTTSQQLRNRLSNEQRRHQDYITSLKQHIKHQQTQLYEHQKQKKVMGELIREYEGKINRMEGERVKHVEQIEMMLVEKEREKERERGKGDGLRKELEVMARQQASIRELEHLLKQSRIQSSVVNQKNGLLKKDLQTLGQTHKTLCQDKEMLEQLLELKLQQIEHYKLQLFQLKRHSSQLQAELNNARQEVSEMQKAQEQGQRAKEKMVKKKVQKLKEVKTLLADAQA